MNIEDIRNNINDEGRRNRNFLNFYKATNIARSMVRFSLCVFHFFFLVSCVLCLVSFATAQDISFQAEVSEKTISLNDYVRLTLTATGAQGINPPELPEIDGIRSRFIGPSTRVSIINGKHSSSYAFIYNLYPTRAGEITIPSMTISVDGKKYTSNPVTINVVAQGAVPAAASSPDGHQEQVFDNRLFITLNALKKEAYLNEKIPVSIHLYIGGVSVRNVEFPQMAHMGFLADELEEHKQYEQIVNGIRYTVVEFNTSIFPVEIGEKMIGPAQEQVEVIFKNSSGNRRSGGFGFFDDDFFEGFLNTYSSEKVTIKSKPVTLRIHPLPDEGKPDGFTGAVGKFTFNVNVSPQEVKVGDPVTVRMKVAGTGSLKTFELKGYESNKDFKAYDAQVTEEDGVKILEQVLIPQREGTLTIPEKEFPFFDPGIEKYRTISWGPTQLKVRKLEESQRFAMVGLPDGTAAASDAKEVLGRDIAFIKTRPGKVHLINFNSLQPVLFSMGLGLVLILWAGGVIFLYFTHRLKTDERFARRMKAPVYARSGLKSAKIFLEEGNSSAFYDELFKTLQKYFSHKFHIPLGAVSREEVVRHLLDKKGSQRVIGNVEGVFERCESARYASAGYFHSDMMEDYQKIQEIIDWVERHC